MRCLESRRPQWVGARLRWRRDLPPLRRSKLSAAFLIPHHFRQPETLWSLQRTLRQLTGCTSACVRFGPCVQAKTPWEFQHQRGSTFTRTLQITRQGVPENGENGIVPTALAIGLRESNASVPEAGSFKATIVPVSVHEHAFDYWDQVKSDVIHWIISPIPPSPTPTATPSASPTPTATATSSPTTTPRPTSTPRMPTSWPHPTPLPRP